MIFTMCITKFNGIIKDDGKDLDLVMPMYNLLKYSSKYSETTRSLLSYSNNEAILCKY